MYFPSALWAPNAGRQPLPEADAGGSQGQCLVRLGMSTKSHWQVPHHTMHWLLPLTPGRETIALVPVVLLPSRGHWDTQLLTDACRGELEDLVVARH